MSPWICTNIYRHTPLDTMPEAVSPITVFISKYDYTDTKGSVCVVSNASKNINRVRQWYDKKECITVYVTGKGITNRSGHSEMYSSTIILTLRTAFTVCRTAPTLILVSVLGQYLIVSESAKYVIQVPILLFIYYLLLRWISMHAKW